MRLFGVTILAVLCLSACGDGLSDEAQQAYDECIEVLPDDERLAETCLEQAQDMDNQGERYEALKEEAYAGNYEFGKKAFQQCVDDIGSGELERQACREVTIPGSGSAAQQDEPEGSARFDAEVDASKVMNPATLRVFIRVTNIGDAPGIPDCKVEARDPSFTYTAIDFWTLDNLEPGDSYVRYEDLTVTKEGASYVSKIKVKCEEAQ
jgi:hypothetical protein